MVFIQMVRKNCSIPLTLSLMVLSCSTGMIFRLYNLGSVWQEGLIISINLLFLIHFVYISILHQKQILSAVLFIVEACSLALTSFFIVQFFCTEYYVHEAPCTAPDSREVYFE